MQINKNTITKIRKFFTGSSNCIAFPSYEMSKTYNTFSTFAETVFKSGGLDKA